MFYSDDPARDWDRYCEYLDKQDEEWHKENDERIEIEIEDIENIIEDLKLCRTNEEVEQTLKDNKREMFYEPDENVSNTIEGEIEILLDEINDLKEELES